MLVALYLRAFLGGIGKFLAGLKFWQIVSLALLVAVGIQTMRLGSEKRHSAKLSAQITKMVAASKAKQDQTKQIVDHYITVEKPVIRERVREIENAPLPGGCRTPDIILNSDI
jgi:hypothetical protein